MWEDIKNYFFTKHLERDIKNNQSQRKIYNINEARNVGVVFDATTMTSINVVRDLERSLIQKGKKVAVFGFVRSLDDRLETNLITNKNLNWYGYPKGTKVENFYKQNFDILIGFFNDSKSPLNVVFANSKSKMRISTDGDTIVNLYDIILNTNKNQSLQEKINSILQFLENVQTK